MALVLLSWLLALWPSFKSQVCPDPASHCSLWLVLLGKQISLERRAKKLHCAESLCRVHCEDQINCNAKQMKSCEWRGLTSLFCIHREHVQWLMQPPGHTGTQAALTQLKVFLLYPEYISKLRKGHWPKEWAPAQTPSLLPRLAFPRLPLASGRTKQGYHVKTSLLETQVWLKSHPVVLEAFTFSYSWLGLHCHLMA